MERKVEERESEGISEKGKRGGEDEGIEKRRARKRMRRE